MRVKRTGRRLAMLGGQAVHGDLGGAISSVARWTWSDTRSIGFERDLTARSAMHAEDGTLHVVRLDARLAATLFRFDGLSGRDWTLLARRRCMWEEGLEGGLVALDAGGDPVFLEWWISPDESDQAQRYFEGLFPPMERGRFVVEGSWVPPEHRGRGVMSQAMRRLGEVAHRDQPENTRAIAFVDERNVPSIKSHQRAGSVPVCIRHESWRAGVLRTEFTPLPHRDPVALDAGSSIQR